MPQVVVTDADVLFGGTTRALFIYLDYADVLRVHWSQRILTEMSLALVRNHRKPSMPAALLNEQLMNASVEAAMLDQVLVDRHEPAMRAFVRDVGDAHVAACAYELATGAYYPAGARPVVLSTRNVADYKVAELAALGISVCHPDAFLITLPLASVARALDSWRKELPAGTSATWLLSRLEKDGNVRLVAALRAGAAVGLFEL